MFCNVYWVVVCFIKSTCWRFFLGILVSSWLLQRCWGIPVVTQMHTHMLDSLSGNPRHFGLASQELKVGYPLSNCCLFLPSKSGCHICYNFLVLEYNRFKFSHCPPLSILDFSLLTPQSSAHSYRRCSQRHFHPTNPSQPNPSEAFLPVYMRDGKSIKNCDSAKSME